jgi:hypothetical protein
MGEHRWSEVLRRRKAPRAASLNRIRPAHAARNLARNRRVEGIAGNAYEDRAEFGKHSVGAEDGSTRDEEQRQQNEPGDQAAKRKQYGLQRHQHHP